MSVLVQKYGGSSVADVERIAKVAARVAAARAAGHDVVVVVSAMGKTTDSLLTLARQAAATFGEGAEPPRRELDMLLTTGERVTMALLSIAVHARGYEAVSLTGSQSGILTNDRHFDARIIEVRPHRIEDELARGKVVIVAGYQGMSYRREITTLGRGGTDTTAVALAAALGAERCEIYSDVDGVYTADPRAVPDAVHLPELTHEMLQEMAECGAKVVCAQAVEWARRAGIAIYARATQDSDPPKRETIVRRSLPSEELRARAVVAEPSVALGRFGGPRSGVAVIDESGLEALLAATADAGPGLKDLSSGPRGGSFVVPLLNVPDWATEKRRLLAAVPGLELVEGLATVSVVGDGLAATGAPVARFVAALRAEGIPVAHLTATPLRITAAIEASAQRAAERALHAGFVPRS